MGETEEVWFGGYELVFFEPFARAQTKHATKWARDIGSTSGSCSGDSRNFVQGIPISL